MNPKHYENTLILAIIGFGYKNQRFTLKDLQSGLRLSPEDITFVSSSLITLDATNGNPNHLLIVDGRTKSGEPLYTITPTALFSYIDHLEIVEARKAAKSARVLSWIAIAVSVILTSLQIIFGK